MNIGTANYVITRQIQNSNIPFKYQVNLPRNTPVGLPKAFQRKTNWKYWIKYIKPIWCPQHSLIKCQAFSCVWMSAILSWWCHPIPWWFQLLCSPGTAIAVWNQIQISTEVWGFPLSVLLCKAVLQPSVSILHSISSYLHGNQFRFQTDWIPCFPYQWVSQSVS